MKSNLMNFIILVYVLYLVRLYLGLKVPPNNYKRSFNELLQCRICMDLFSYDFNYDEYLKNKATLAQIKESLIASKLAFQGKDEEVSKNKIEVISREISMKYFFKGSDYNEDTNKIKMCIAKSKERINNSNNKNDNYDKECEIVLSKACEFILSFEKNKCSVPFLSLSSSSDIHSNDNSLKIQDTNKLSNNFKSDLGNFISKEVNENKEDSASSLKVSSTSNNDSNNIQISNLIQLLGKKSNNSKDYNDNNKNNLNTLLSLISSTNKDNKSNENNENSENNNLIKDLIAKLSGQQKIQNHNNHLTPNNIKNGELENSITSEQNLQNSHNSNNQVHANSYISRIHNIHNTDIKDKIDNIDNIGNLNSTIDPQYKKLEDLSKLLNLESNKYVNNDNSNNSSILNKLKFKQNDNTSRKASMSFINRNNSNKANNNNKQIYLNKNKSANNLKQIQSLLTPEVLLALGLKQANNRNSITQQNYNSDNSNPYSLNNMQHSSLLELSLTPESIANNYTPSSPSDILKQDGNKSWSAPKPVIFDNFQDSLGGQLKDISYLTNEIAKYESKLKGLKQQLANKLEIAQSSYNVVQKTLSQISSFIKEPEVFSSPLNINSNQGNSNSDDDWDESVK